MLDSTKPEQPSLMAIELCSRHLSLREQSTTCRAMAAQLRRDAKATQIKSDAFAMRKKAKELSVQAVLHKKDAERAYKDFVNQAEHARQLLCQRMPPQWTQWDVVKTRAYTNLIDVVAKQMQRAKVNCLLVSTALKHLTDHDLWSATLISRLASMKPATKEIPE